MTRQPTEFLVMLQRFGVTPFQYDAAEIIREVTFNETWP